MKDLNFSGFPSDIKIIKNYTLLLFIVLQQYPPIFSDICYLNPSKMGQREMKDESCTSFLFPPFFEHFMHSLSYYHNIPSLNNVGVDRIADKGLCGQRRSIMVLI